MSSSTIQVSNVSCTFQHDSGREVQALKEVSLEISPGELVCLVGRSGHGKSTLLRAIAGLNSLSEGQIYVGNEVVQKPSAQRSMVFQEDTVFPWMKVRDNVEFGLKAQGMDSRESAQIASEWLHAVRLTDFAGSFPKELSGGMRKRVAIASVFATGAEILLMDEPFGALDYVTRLSLHQLLLDLWQKTKRTIVFVTHDIEEALILANRIVIMGHGRVVDILPVQLPRPRTEEVRASQEAVLLTKTIMKHLGLDDLFYLSSSDHPVVEDRSR